MLTNQILFYVAISLVPMIFFFAVIFLYIKDRLERRGKLVSTFERDRAILEFNMEKAYELIHKDDIFIYSVEATKLPEDEFDNATKKFVRLVEKLLGPRLIKYYIFIYGNYDTFVFNLVEFFNSKYENDEIRAAARQDLMESEIETGETPL